MMIKRLGYKLHMQLIWSKLNGPCPAFTLKFSHEYLLFCYFGKFTPINLNYRGKFTSVFVEKSIKHSKKPEFSYQMICNLYPSLKKLELFSREKRQGFDHWGNQIDSDISINGYKIYDGPPNE